jgi:hypothetical protein
MELSRRTFMATAAAAAALQPTRLVGAQAPLGAPVRITDRRVLMDCTFANGQRWPFVIDTGGAFGLIRSDVARAMGLRNIDEQRLLLRTGNRSYPIFEAREFLLGGVIRQGSITFAGVDGIFPPDQAGSLPAGILTELPAELALGRGEWRLWPDGAPDRAGWTAYADAIREAELPSGSPMLMADVVAGGTTIRVGLDTGMPSNNYLYGRAAERAGLTATDRWAPAPPMGRGRVVRAPLTMAGYTAQDALVTVVETAEWREFPNGIMGLGLLQSYDIATDPPRAITYLRPNGRPAVPMSYNRFGAWIGRRGDDIVLETIGPGSPADQAGLRRGDRITGISFADMVSRMYGRAGEEIAFTLLTRTGRRPMTVRLADYL